MLKIKLLFAMLIINASLTTELWASPAPPPNEVRETQIIQLINTIGSNANKEGITQADKDNAQFAYNGFISRFQGIHDKNISADIGQKKIDQLLSDINGYFSNLPAVSDSTPI
jgi:hypothetical protein